MGAVCVYSASMRIDPSEISARKIYRLMTFAIAPRPIAWVGTVSEAGITNLAPFSFFNGVCASPPTVIFSCSVRRDGSVKDTLRNLQAVPEFTISTVSFAQGDKMNLSATELPYGDSEFATYQIAAQPSERIRPPRVQQAKLAFECTLQQLIPVGEGPLSATLVLGRIVLVHIDDSVIDPAGDPIAENLDLIGRMGGDGYCRTSEHFTLTRPKEK